jgi:hypothetical protein
MYFCEYEHDEHGRPIESGCDAPATRLIEVLKYFPLEYQVTDEYFLCHKHTLLWLEEGGRKTMHTIQSVVYRDASVASWIGPNGEDGSEPPIGKVTPSNYPRSHYPHTDPGF